MSNGGQRLKTDKMSETKTIVFPENTTGNSGMLAMLAPLLQQKGVDPNLLACMNRNGYGTDGSWFMWVIFLLFLCNGYGFGNGYGNNGAGGLANMMNNDAGRELLMSAIQGNGTAIGQLATKLNCDINTISNAITNLSSLIQGVGNQVGMSGQQIINAVQSGDCNIATQLQQGFCNVGSKITESGYENRLSVCQQTNSLTNAISAGVQSIKDATDLRTDAIMARLDQQEKNAMQAKIDSLQETKSTLQTQLAMEHQTQQLQGYQAQVVIPIQQALAAMQSELNAIKAAQPATTTIPYSPVVGVPASVAMQYGYSNGTSFWN